MKKIGIMSMQRIHNYGSFMQAYALREIIRSFGYEVEFIDYIYESGVGNKSNNIIKKIKSNINIVQFLKKRKSIRKFAQAYDNEFLPLLDISNKQNHNKKIDALVIGSDEVFNCIQPYPVGFSRSLFGKGYEHTNVISYAASFGFTTLSDLKKYKMDIEIESYLKKFAALSVRDNNSFDIINSLVKKKPIINLDPVLLYDFPEKKLKVDCSNYIIIYAYPGRFSRHEEKMIKKFAKKHNKKILSLGSYQRIADEIRIVNPLEIFNYFKNSDFVITDTFHGSIFSIKSKVKFCTIIRESNKNKLMDLLKRLHLENRVVNSIEEIEELYKENIDFSKTYSILEKEKQKMIKYFEKNL